MKLVRLFQTLLASILFALLAAENILIQKWTDKQLEKLDENGSEINRIYLIYADWCGACRRYKPKFEKIVNDLLNPASGSRVPNLEAIQINLDKASLISSRFRVSHLPSVYHQIGGEFRKLDAFKDKLDVYFKDKLWLQTPSMGPLSPPRGKGAPKAPVKANDNFSYKKYIEEELKVSVPVFILLTGTTLMLIVMFIIWCIWLYTDYKLNAHNFTEEGVRKRIKELRKHPDFKDQFYFSDKDDSGEESDTENDNEKNEPETDSDDFNEIGENTPLQKKRPSSIKDRLK